MKILLYNWVPFDDAEGRGGGVRHYQRNLVDRLVAGPNQVHVISSGLEHDKFDPRMRVEPTTNAHGSRVASFVFVNSPVLAPGQHCFGTTHLFDDGEPLQAWHHFLREHGPFDVIQFDSLEGIPFSFLRVHEVHPDTRVLLYAHNYYSVCPQVNLWKNEEAPCRDYHDGRDCATCLPHEVNQDEVLRAHQLSRLLRNNGIRPGTRTYHASYAAWARLRARGFSLERSKDVARTIVQPARQVYDRWASPATSSNGIAGPTSTNGVSDPASTNGVSPSFGDEPPPSTATADDPPPATSANGVRPTAPTNGVSPGTDPTDRDGSSSRTNLPLATPLHRHERFRTRREQGTELINREVDVVVATSQRVVDVLAARGIHRERIEVSYIGTTVADNVDPAERRTELREPGRVCVAYLGYMRRDKGFHSLLTALEEAPLEAVSRIQLVVAAKRSDGEAFRRLQNLAQRTAGTWHYNGYEHDELPAILDRADIGIVPVQWEDNLPQVAIEMVAHGLPILTSDRGGAQELGGANPPWTYPATDNRALVDRLTSIAIGTTPLSTYWNNARDLVTMDDHIARMATLYDASVAPRDADTGTDTG